MTEDEDKIIAAMQKAFAELHDLSTRMMAVQMKARNAKAFNAAYVVKTAIDAAHVIAGEKLLECYPDSQDVMLRGPGGR